MANRFVLNNISYHGSGAIKEVPGEITRRGYKKAFVASDPDLVKFGVTAKVTDRLDEAGIAWESFKEIKPNPTIKNVQDGVAAFKASGADCIVAVGGGSAMDTAKAIGIIAENPDIKPFEAAKLSWLMMRGNKWKLFMMSMSFMGWYILGSFTFGLSNIFFSNPYMICCYSEYYAQIRKHAKEKGIRGTEMLNDEYLFVRADSNTLADVYSDVLAEISKDDYSLEHLEGRREKFFAKNFGVILWNSKEEIEYENRQAHRMKMQAYEKEATGLVYPSRLSPIPEQRRIKALDNIHYMRHYSLSSLAMLFVIFSNFGWTWELFYYFLMKGQLINRGFNHGPWLPIYGFGGLIVLMGLHRVRKRPVVFFFSTIISCGAVEYFTSWFLEAAFNKKWWDYSGYFLNLNSRICAEGLFVFGVCGLAFIYVLAPLLDNLIRKINRKILVPLAVVLVMIIAADFVYSNFVPNTGYGITGNFDYEDDVAVESVLEEG